MAKKKQNRYEKAIEDIQKEKENYLLSQFEYCHPQAKELSKTYTETVWTDSMRIMQDFPSDYTRTAAICFFSFLGVTIDSYLKLRFQKDIATKDLPVVLPVPADSDMVKKLLERGEKELGTDGLTLLKNLIERDFGLLMAILKAIRIENAIIHNVLVSGFRFWVWEVMIPHLFQTEKKEDKKDEGNK